MTNEPKFRREKSRKSKSDNENFEIDTTVNNVKPEIRCEQCEGMEHTQENLTDIAKEINKVGDDKIEIGEFKLDEDPPKIDYMDV